MSTIDHATAAQLLGVSPAALTEAVRVGDVRRNDDKSYTLPALVQGYIAHVASLQDRLERRPTQREAGEHLDLSERSIRDLEVALGLKGQDYTLSKIRVAYIRKQREEAAGRAAEGDMSLATERAALARAQREKIEMQNAVTRRELAPTAMIEEILANVGVRAAKLLETIPGELRRRNPNMSSDELGAVAEIVAKARNAAANISMADLEMDEDGGDDDDIDDDADSDPDKYSTERATYSQ